MEISPATVALGGHQTFSFRHGWLERGFHAIDKNKESFNAEDAIVQLGVGKNMVDSIRHWCIATQLIEGELDPSGKRVRNGYRATQMGALLLDPADGWDRYLEDNASLWLIHWLLVSNLHRRTIWQVVFAHFHKADFSKAELSDFLLSYLGRHREAPVNPTTLAREIDCFCKTYVAPVLDGGFTEENFDCPLVDLGLIRQSPNGRTMHFDIGAKSSLPPAVFYFAFEQFLAQSGSDKKTMTIHDCLYSPGGPGQAFKLDENAIFDYVEALSEITRGALLLDDTADVKQIYRVRPLPATDVLEQYYRRRGDWR